MEKRNVDRGYYVLGLLAILFIFFGGPGAMCLIDHGHAYIGVIVMVIWCLLLGFCIKEYAEAVEE